MPYYVLESFEANLNVRGATLRGVPTTGYSPAIWLYVVNSEEAPLDWPESPTGRGSGRRRAPAGVGNWWVVLGRGAKARSDDALRLCSTRNTLPAVPNGYSSFSWP
jgi:hypothetical protein